MNSTQLDIECKKAAKKCFTNFKHHITYHPLDNQINSITIDNAILVTIKQEFKRTALKKVIEGNESNLQLNIIKYTTNWYEELIIKTCYRWAVNNNYLIND